MIFEQNKIIKNKEEKIDYLQGRLENLEKKYNALVEWMSKKSNICRACGWKSSIVAGQEEKHSSDQTLEHHDEFKDNHDSLIVNAGSPEKQMNLSSKSIFIEERSPNR